MVETGKIPEQLFVFEREGRRLELLVRIFYSIAIAIVLWVYGLIAGICLIIQWFVILILGRRNEDLSNFIRGYLEFYVHVLSYVYWMTDRRPGIMPRTVRIFEGE
jgi:amino acid permease